MIRHISSQIQFKRLVLKYSSFTAVVPNVCATTPRGTMVTPSGAVQLLLPGSLSQDHLKYHKGLCDGVRFCAVALQMKSATAAISLGTTALPYSTYSGEALPQKMHVLEEGGRQAGHHHSPIAFTDNLFSRESSPELPCQLCKDHNHFGSPKSQNKLSEQACY